MAEESIKSTNMLYDYVIIESVSCILVVVKEKKEEWIFLFPFPEDKDNKENEQ